MAIWLRKIEYNIEFSCPAASAAPFWIDETASIVAGGLLGDNCNDKLCMSRHGNSPQFRRSFGVETTLPLINSRSWLSWFCRT